MIPFQIRRATPADHDFIAGSFKASLKHGGDFDWSRSDFGKEMDRRLAEMFSTAVVAEMGSGLLGWAAGGDRLLHYVYVKQPYRGEGVAEALVIALGGPTKVTHWTRGAALHRKRAAYEYWPTYWREHK
jgi:GNAT superfamily N-acetyltransferase